MSDMLSELVGKPRRKFENIMTKWRWRKTGATLTFPLLCGLTISFKCENGNIAKHSLDVSIVCSVLSFVWKQRHSTFLMGPMKDCNRILYSENPSTGFYWLLLASLLIFCFFWFPRLVWLWLVFSSVFPFFPLWLLVTVVPSFCFF